MTKKDENLFDPEEENKKAQELARKQQEEGDQGGAPKKGEKELGSQAVEPDQSMQPPKHTTEDSPKHKEK
jgi:hypothetical protein